MGFFDTLKKVALSAKCLTGWHGGNYNSIKGKPQCHLEKTCPDCKEYITKIDHKYGGWKYLNYDNCEAEKECIYCREIKREIVHNYKERGKDSNCRIIEICEHCQDEKLGSTKHNWIRLGSIELKAGGKRKCKDCGQMES